MPREDARKQKRFSPYIFSALLLLLAIGIMNHDKITAREEPPEKPQIMKQTSGVVTWRDCVTMPRQEGALADKIVIVAREENSPVPAQCVRIRPSYVYDIGDRKHPFTVEAISGERFSVLPSVETWISKEAWEKRRVKKLVFRFFATGKDEVLVNVKVRAP